MSYVPTIEQVQGDQPFTDEQLATTATSDVMESFLAMSVITMQFAQAGQPPKGFVDNFAMLKGEIDRRIPSRKQ